MIQVLEEKKFSSRRWAKDMVNGAYVIDCVLTSLSGCTLSTCAFYAFTLCTLSAWFLTSDSEDGYSKILSF